MHSGSQDARAHWAAHERAFHLYVNRLEPVVRVLSARTALVPRVRPAAVAAALALFEKLVQQEEVASDPAVPDRFAAESAVRAEPESRYYATACQQAKESQRARRGADAQLRQFPPIAGAAKVESAEPGVQVQPVFLAKAARLPPFLRGRLWCCSTPDWAEQRLQAEQSPAASREPTQDAMKWRRSEPPQATPAER